VIGTGGMSHQLHGERFGHLARDFDRAGSIASSAIRKPYAGCLTRRSWQAAGAESVELIMWLVMRGALSGNIQQQHLNYYAPMTTGMGLISLAPA